MQEAEDAPILVIINPEIISKSGTQVVEEGCLSFPNKFAKIERPEKIKVRALNEAMVNNMIILAFDNTAHSKELYPMGNIFESSNYVKMKETLKNIITSQTIFNEYIDRQKKQLIQ